MDVYLKKKLNNNIQLCACNNVCLSPDDITISFFDIQGVTYQASLPFFSEMPYRISFGKKIGIIKTLVKNKIVTLWKIKTIFVIFIGRRRRKSRPEGGGGLRGILLGRFSKILLYKTFILVDFSVV